LVELLVVIAIIGILVGLLLPAIQSSRESARKTQCKNNLKQMATAFLSHENAQGFFPSSGWGNDWVGDPDGGFGATQPGGWAYSILPYMEYGALYDAGNRLKQLALLSDFDPDNDPSQGEFTLTLVTTMVPVFNCPTKRPAQLYPMYHTHGQLAYNCPTCSQASGCQVARGDYLVNSGNIAAGDLHGPPPPYAPPFYPVLPSSWAQNGISYERSETRIGEITDGTSKTAMVGEKYQDPDNYFTGADWNDNQCVYSGHNSDSNGYTGTGDGVSSVTSVYRPRQDQAGARLNHYFGSAHLDGLHMANCDGSVHFIGYDVSGRVWFVLGGRDDEEKPPRSED
jgi:type II secretory pathway pseudopilin PulG